MTTATHNMLSSIYLFKDLSEDDINELAKQTTLKYFPKNVILVNEGDETDSLYIIESGKIKIYVGDEEGKELTLTLHGPGDYFGERSTPFGFSDDIGREQTIHYQKTTI